MPAPQTPAPAALEPPVPSPPGELPAAARLAWWEERAPMLAAEDRLEARLCMGELLLELERSQEARYAFYEVIEAPDVTVREAARAERGVGLAYFLEGQAPMGLPHLERARGGLEQPAAAEAGYLIAAGRGHPLAVDAALAGRVQPYLDAAGLLVAVPPPPSAVPPRQSPLVDVTRAQWKARAMLANHDPMTKPYRITLHHTAEPMPGDTLPATITEVQNIQMLHMRDRDWADIGYHFLIDRAGRVIEGRSLEVQGAHAGNSDANRGNLGIALLGNFAAQPERGPQYTRVQEPTAVQLQALGELVGALQQRFSISNQELWAHDHFRETECPGGRLRSWVMAHRSERRAAGGAVNASAKH
jgi:hypothetical protein